MPANKTSRNVRVYARMWMCACVHVKNAKFAINIFHFAVCKLIIKLVSRRTDTLPRQGLSKLNQSAISCPVHEYLTWL